ncbi:MAG: hypothetical protein JWN44_5157 [Myxococcales bacterium]|nr:hypothetical protein [Myxococcales bacterium]
MRALLACSIVAAAGCQSPPLATPPRPPEPCAAGDVLCIESSSGHDEIDVLFVLDDAPSMGVKLAALRAALPRLLATLDGYPAQGVSISYHVGVVTADLGAGPATLPQLGCHPGGDGAVLRSSDGVRFIDVDQISGTRNVADVPAALAALVDVGTGGCEFRHPLEAAYRALHDPIVENAGFLRSNALLWVVFVSDADDCSAPATTDLFDGSAAGLAAYGPLDHFRCTQFGIACNGAPVPPRSIAGLTDCRSQQMADGGKLFDVARYIDFFTRPAARGGVKTNPDDVTLVAVAAPADSLAVSITSPCAADASAAACPTLDRSCVATSDPMFFGDPAVRLHEVIHAAKNHGYTSVCDADDTAAFAGLTQLSGPRGVVDCLDRPVAARADGSPDCTAEDETANPDGSTAIAELPSCAVNGHVVPCWQLVDRLAQYQTQGCAPPGQPPTVTCKLPSTCQPVTNPTDGRRELSSAVIDRGIDASGNPLRPAKRTTTRVSCATIPPP